jgi:hypothetical protein
MVFIMHAGDYEPACEAARNSRGDLQSWDGGEFFKWKYYEGPFYGKKRFWGFLQNATGCYVSTCHVDPIGGSVLSEIVLIC